jgi:hypothetical protein
LDKSNVSVKTAKNYLKTFEGILPDMSTKKTKVRFEVRARLPPDFHFNSTGSHTLLQYILDAVIEVQQNEKWINLPVPHIQQVMQRVFDFVTLCHAVPPRML